MSSEQTINQTQSQVNELNSDVWIPWSSKSEGISFEGDKKKCIGNGEEMVGKELGITTKLGGQNSTADLIHPKMGHISVKDMTSDNCTLGTDGCKSLREIFRKIVVLFVCWASNYESSCKLAKEYYDAINKKYGLARITLLEGIDKFELADGGKKNIGNLPKLVELLEKLKQDKQKYDSEYKSLSSEYIKHIISNLGDKSLQDLLNECVRKEATDMTLIIVHKKKGWLIVKDINKLSCPRITRGAPRIDYN